MIFSDQCQCYKYGINSSFPISETFPIICLLLLLPLRFKSNRNSSLRLSCVYTAGALRASKEIWSKFKYSICLLQTISGSWVLFIAWPKSNVFLNHLHRVQSPTRKEFSNGIGNEWLFKLRKQQMVTTRIMCKLTEHSVCLLTLK